MKINLFKKSIAASTSFIFILMCLIPSSVLASHLHTWHSGGQQVGGSTSVSGTNVTGEPQQDPVNNSCLKGKPVYIHSGEEYYECTDLFIPGRGMDLAIKHIYRSGKNYNGRFGYGWTINYHIRLKQLDNGNVVIVDGNGRSDEYTYDGQGGYISPPGFFERLVQNGNGTWTLIKAHGEKYNFDINGNIASIVDRNNNTIAFQYDTFGISPIIGVSLYSQNPGEKLVIGQDYKLVKIIDTVGRQVDFTYDADGKLDYLTDYAGRVVDFTYDPATDDLLSIKRPATAQFPAGITKTFTYYTGHKLHTITDAKSQTFVTNVYDSQGRVQQQTLGNGTYTFNYNVANQTTVTDRKGFVTTYVYDANGNVTRKEQFTQGIHAGGPASFITQTAYNADMLITSITYPRGNGVKFVYDSANPDPRAHGNVLQIRRKVDMALADDDLNDLVTNITYEAQYNFPKTITDPKGNTTTYTYDYELPPSDPRYGTVGNLVQIDAPTVTAGTPITTFDYNANGQLIMVEDPNNIVTEYDYFPATGYLKEIRQDPSGINAVTQFTYDQFGNLDIVTDANGAGHETDYDYDALGWLNTVTNALGYVTNYFYDANGNVERVERQASDPVGTWQVTQFTYDTLNNLKTITDPLSRVTTFNYDLNENLASSIDAETNTTTYVYDERDLLFTVTDANTPAGVTTYDYDNNGNLAKITDAETNATTYAFDLFDRLDTMTYADSTFVDYTYDENSNLDFIELPGTHGTIDYGYDVLNRLTTVDYGSGTPDKSFDYDLGSRLTDADAGTILNDFTYDNLNRVKTNTQTLNAVAYTLTYNYEDNGNRKDVTYPSTKFIEYTYDVHDRLDLVKVGGNTLVDYDYDPLDRRDLKSFNPLALNPLVADYSFDIANQLSSITNTILPSTNISTYAYPVYDNVSNRKQMDFTSQAGTPVTTNYVYNDIYELTSTSGGQAHTFVYDNVANRINADGTIYVPNNLNQYASVGATTYSYDFNGNLTGDGTNAYVYDEENRLTTTNTVNLYEYDAFNRRVKKDVNGTSTYFVYDGDQVIAEYDHAVSTSVPQAEYVYGDGIDEVLTMDRNSSAYYYHYDGLGSVTEVTDATGAIQERYEYDVYGKPMMFNAAGTQIAASAIGNHYMFTGREYDEETGLYHYRNRTYDPTIGRFLQRDPIGTYDHLNLYQYTGNDPINFIDPYGLYSMYDFLRDASNFSAGFGDTITFGGTNYLRDLGGFNDVVDHCSDAYAAGGYSATAAEIAAGGAGIAKVFSKKGLMIIGENMAENVIPKAIKYGAEYYKPAKMFKGPLKGKKLNKALKNNYKWLKKKFEQGYEYIDAGTMGNNSPFYKMEKYFTKKMNWKAKVVD